MQTLARVQRVPGLAAPRPTTRPGAVPVHPGAQRGAKAASSGGLAAASASLPASSVATRALPTDRFAKLWGEERLADLTLLICLRDGDDASRVTCKRLPVTKLVLEAHGALEAMLGASTPAVEEGGKLPAAVVTVADEEEASAAEAVLRLMYAGDLPAGLSVQQLERMRTVANRWGAELIAAACKAARAALAQREMRAATTLEDRLAFVTRSMTTLSSELFQDVHLLLTTPARLELFLQLPFEGVLAWAGSDGLVVDSENSVVVALDCWVRLGHGQECSKEQLLQLSGLVRIKHLTPSFLDSTVALPWWCSGGGARSFPLAWLAPPRQQLPRDVLRQRTTITWAIPRKELEDALSDPESSYLFSPPVFLAGSAVKVGLEIAKADKAKSLRQACAYLCTSAYELDGEEEHLVVPKDRPFTLNGYKIVRSKVDGYMDAHSTPWKTQLVKERTDVNLKLSLDTSKLDRELLRGHLVLRASLHLDV